MRIGTIVLVTLLAALAFGNARAQDILVFRWLQPGNAADGQVPASDVDWAILYVGSAPFVEGALDAVNGDIAAAAIETPEPVTEPIGPGLPDGEVYTHAFPLAAPLPRVTVYQTMRVRVGVDGRPSAGSNTQALPLPEAPVLLHPTLVTVEVTVRRVGGE